MYRLDSKQTALIEELRRVADESIAPSAAEVDSKGRYPREAIDALGKTGWLGLNVPVEHGGMGQGLRLAAAALDEVGQRCASTAMVYLMHLCGCAAYVASPEGSDAVLRAAAKGEHLSTLAWSERGSRSHFWAPVSRATKRDGNVVLNAQKSYVTSATEADGYVVSTGAVGASEPTSTTLYLVLREDPGVRVSGRWDSLGMRGNDSAPMTLEGCEIPAERALSVEGQGFPRMLELLPTFNIGNAAIEMGIAAAAVAATTTHLTSTRLDHLNESLASQPALRSRLAWMQLEVDRGRAHLDATIDAIEAGAPNATLMVLESKASAAETAAHVTQLGMEACGGAAYAKRNSVERNFRDARASAVMAPTTDALVDFIGRALCGMELM